MLYENYYCRLGVHDSFNVRFFNYCICLFRQVFYSQNIVCYANSAVVFFCCHAFNKFICTVHVTYIDDCQSYQYDDGCGSNKNRRCKAVFLCVGRIFCKRYCRNYDKQHGKEKNTAPLQQKCAFVKFLQFTFFTRKC